MVPGQFESLVGIRSHRGGLLARYFQFFADSRLVLLLDDQLARHYADLVTVQPVASATSHQSFVQVSLRRAQRITGGTLAIDAAGIR